MKQQTVHTISTSSSILSANAAHRPPCNRMSDNEGRQLSPIPLTLVWKAPYACEPVQYSPCDDLRLPFAPADVLDLSDSRCVTALSAE